MTENAFAPDKAENQLWEELEQVGTGMLGLEGSGQHMQPMAHRIDRANKTLFFFSNRDSDLVRAIGTGARSHFCLVGHNHDFHACIGGQISQVEDRSLIDKYWSATIAAWFPEGKDDPHLALLKLLPADAMVWISTTNAIKFAWEIAKANVSDSEPDLGAKAHIEF